MRPFDHLYHAAFSAGPLIDRQEREPEDMEVQADLDELSDKDDEDGGSTDNEALDTDNEDEGDATIDTDVSDGESRLNAASVILTLYSKFLCISCPFTLFFRARTK